jgi:hypothetical protein
MQQSEIYLVESFPSDCKTTAACGMLAASQLECATRARNCALACQMLSSSRVEGELALAEMRHARAGLTAAASNVVVAR